VAEQRDDPMRLWVGTWMPTDPSAPKAEQKREEDNTQSPAEERVAPPGQ
jgi:hypothetical protein